MSRAKYTHPTSAVPSPSHARARRTSLVLFLVLSLVVAIGLICAAYRRDLRVAGDRSTAGSRIAQTPCGPIEYSVLGQGVPVLVVHGAGGGFDQGLRFAAPLAERGFRIVAMSRFGYLRTPLPNDASAEAQAAAHVCLLDALHIRRIAIIGASAGAPSSMLFALRYPERTVALILLVPAAYVPRPDHGAPLKVAPGTELAFNTALRSDFVLWAATRVARRTLVQALLATPPQVVDAASPAEQERVAMMLESILPVSARRLGLKNDAAVTSTLPRYDLEHIVAPTLAISVADDLFGTFDAARYTAEHIVGARFIGYPNGGHVLVGHQEDVFKQIATFLSLRETGDVSPTTAD